MKSIHLFLFAAFLVFTACNQTSTGQSPADTNTTTMETPDRLLRHVVLFNFTDDAPQDTIQLIEQTFAALPGKIPEIHSFEWGINNSPEGLDKGLTHCFFVTFLSEEDRGIYLPHPAHQEFVALIGPYVEDVTVVDYWTK
jgi:hypothetical protein